MIKKEQKIKNQEQIDKLTMELEGINNQKLDVTQKRGGFNG